jgi:hypothetical protein
VARVRDGDAAVEQIPAVEQVTEGDDAVQDVPADAVDLLEDREWLCDQLVHRDGCPMAAAPFDAADDQPARAQRMETYDVAEPWGTPDRRTFRIIACLDCGNRAKVEVPR